MNERDQSVNPEISAAATMQQIITNFRVSRATYVAAKLGIADLLKDGPKSSEDLAQLTGTHAPSLDRVLRVLACTDIFSEDNQGRFALTPLGATLRSDTPNSLRASAIVALGEARYQAWGDLLHNVRTGETAFDHVFGMGVWEYQTQHPDQARIFDESMANRIAANNTAVVASYPFSTIDKLVDVGGGNGSFIISLLQANPQMKGVLFDLPQVAEHAKKRIDEAGLEERCQVIGGDIFASIPGEGSAYVLSGILNSFNNDRAITILQNCHRAMTPNTKMLLVDRVLPDRTEQSSPAQAAIVNNLHMMVTTGGRERSRGELRILSRAAGFEIINIIPTQSVMSVIECVPV